MITLKQFSVTASLAVMLLLNTLAVVLPLNQISTKELSDAIPTLFTPAGYVFSIWSIIYIALIGYAVYQIMPVNRLNVTTQSTAWLFVINALANASWIMLWHYRHVYTSVVVMLVILVTLIMIYQRLGIGVRIVHRAEYWFLHFPFSIYLGWISVATIANITAALYVYNWNGWGIAPATWSAALVVIAALLAIAMVVRRRDYVFAGVVVWAVIGIAVKFNTIGLIYWVSLVSAIAMACAVLVRLVSRRAL